MAFKFPYKTRNLILNKDIQQIFPHATISTTAATAAAAATISLQQQQLLKLFPTASATAATH